MSIAVALLTASLTAASPTALPSRDTACTGHAPRPAADTLPPPGAKKLDQLPPHRQYMTVLRRERGCDVAVIKENGRNLVVPLPDQKGLQPLQTGWR